MKHTLLFSSLLALSVTFPFEAFSEHDNCPYLMDCGDDPYTYEAMIDPAAPSGLNVDVIKKRQKECRKRSAGHDISTIIVNFMQDKYDIEHYATTLAGWEKLKAAHELILTKLSAELKSLEKKKPSKNNTNAQDKIKDLRDRIQKLTLKIKEVENKIRGLKMAHTSQTEPGHFPEVEGKIKKCFPDSKPANLPAENSATS